jgi:hypothetical protein
MKLVTVTCPGSSEVRGLKSTSTIVCGYATPEQTGRRDARGPGRGATDERRRGFQPTDSTLLRRELSFGLTA